MNAILHKQSPAKWNENIDSQMIVEDNFLIDKDFKTIENQLIQNGLDDILLNKTKSHDEVKMRFEMKFSKK